MLNWYTVPRPPTPTAVGPITAPRCTCSPECGTGSRPAAAHATAGHVEGPFPARGAGRRPTGCPRTPTRSWWACSSSTSSVRWRLSRKGPPVTWTRVLPRSASASLPLAHRLPARGLRPLGAGQLALRPPHRAGSSCCASRTRCRARPSGADRERAGDAPVAGAAVERAARQSQRHQLYADAAAKLVADGSVYTCECTGDQVQARNKESGGKPGYDGFCRSRGLEPRARSGAPLPHAARRPHRVDQPGPRPGVVRQRRRADFVVVRGNGAPPCSCWPTASTTTDMGITHVIHGEDRVEQHTQVPVAARGTGAPASPRPSPTCRCW